MRAFTSTLFAALFALPLHADAQAGDASGFGAAIITPARPVWLLEQPYADSPKLTARTVGVSAYGGFHVKASLEISCYPQNPLASLALQIAPQSLGFDSDPFEGKDASASGPLRVTTGTRASIELPVNGVWTDGGAFQIGTLFVLSAAVPPAELAYWLSDASQGQTLTLSLAPATAGAGAAPLTATFVLPENNTGLNKILRACRGVASATPR